MVVPIPLGILAEADEEGVFPFDLADEVCRIRHARGFSAQAIVETLEWGAFEQEAGDIGAKPVQYLVDEVVGDVAVLSGQRAGERLWVLMVEP